MTIRDLIPRKPASSRSLAQNDRDPYQAMQNQMNRMLTNFWRDPWDMQPFQDLWDQEARFSPRVDVAETDQEVVVTAEIPGMEEKDIVLSLEHDTLILQGKKEVESETKDSRHHQIERHFGSFVREIVMPAEIEEDKVEATFKNGILTVHLPKNQSMGASKKRIQIKPG